MILFDLEKGSSSSIGSKCYVNPETKFTEDLIEVICEEKPECKDKECPELFDITTEIIYEPFDIFKG